MAISKKWLTVIIIASAVILTPLSIYFGIKQSFNSIRGIEQFAMINMSGNVYYLNVEAKESKSQLSIKKYKEINGVKYSYIMKTGKYKFVGPRHIFHCQRNDDLDIYMKMQDLFSEFNIVDKNNNTIWDLYDENSQPIERTETISEIVQWHLSWY